jgi:2-methylisocitrate lyase-like PEP mutase family enzyme
MTDIAAKATELLRLHHTGSTLVLPTVWDAWSATTVVDAGFPALSVGSHPVANSRGQKDNEGMTLADNLDSVRRITGSVDVPVTADVESGYDTPAAELVERVLEAGAVGINVEDTVHSEGRLRDVQEHADYIGALRAAADEAGVELVINARTDAFLGKVTTFEDPLGEAVRRLQACVAAGARSVYPVGVPDAATLRTLLAELSGPVNITAHPVKGAPSGSFEELKAAGVHRITFGPLLMVALEDDVAELVKPWL